MLLANGQPFAKCLTNGYFWQRHVTLNAAGAVTACDEAGAGVAIESGCRYLAHWAMAQAAQYLVLDMEGKEATLANVTQVLTWVRSEIGRMGGKLKVSFYTVDGNADDYPDRFTGWIMKPEWRHFLNSLDFVCPSFYGYRDLTQANWMADWQATVQRVTRATRAITQKPMLPFISPRYWDGGQFVPAGSMIPAAVLPTMASTVLAASNGLVVWDPACDLQGPEVPAAWDGNAAWWQTIKGVK